MDHSACSALNGTSVSTKNKQSGVQEPEKGDKHCEVSAGWAVAAVLANSRVPSTR